MYVNLLPCIFNCLKLEIKNLFILCLIHSSFFLIIVINYLSLLILLYQLKAINIISKKTMDRIDRIMKEWIDLNAWYIELLYLNKITVYKQIFINIFILNFHIKGVIMYIE